MRLVDLLDLIQNETETENYLRQIGILKRFDFCIKCVSDKTGIVRRNRFKCYKCKSEWSTRKNSILETSSLSLQQFLMAVKLFEMEINAQNCSAELNLGYKAVHNLYTSIRFSISGLNKSSIEKFSRVTAQEKRIGIEKQKDGFCFNYTDPSENYFSMLRSKGKITGVIYELKFNKVKKTIKKGNDKKFSEYNEFWRFTKEKLMKFNGVEDKYLILYLKEIEFRFNHKKDNLFDEICMKISEFDWVANKA